MRAKASWKLRLLRRLATLLETSLYVQADFAMCADDVTLDPGVFISDPDHVRLERGAAIYRGTKIFCGPGSFSLGCHSHLAGDVYINALHGHIRLGNGVAVGPKTVIVSYTNHYEAGKPIAETRKIGDVSIGDDVFIGAHVVILPGISVGTGAVIGAGSVVTHNVEANQVVAGNPARLIRIRNS